MHFSEFNETPINTSNIYYQHFSQHQYYRYCWLLALSTTSTNHSICYSLQYSLGKLVKKKSSSSQPHIIEFCQTLSQSPRT